jgi:hypothetical protein
MDSDKKKPDQMTVTISFKKNEKWVYDEIIKHSCKSAYVKEIVIAKIAEELYGEKNIYSQNKQKSSQVNDANVIDSMNLLGDL